MPIENNIRKNFCPTHVMTFKKLNAVTNRYNRITVQAQLIDNLLYFIRNGRLQSAPWNDGSIEAYMEL